MKTAVRVYNRIEQGHLDLFWTFIHFCTVTLPQIVKHKKEGGGHTGQVGATTTCSQNKHVGEFLYFKLPKLPVQVKSRPIKDVTKYVLNTDVQFTN